MGQRRRNELKERATAAPVRRSPWAPTLLAVAGLVAVGIGGILWLRGNRPGDQEARGPDVATSATEEATADGARTEAAESAGQDQARKENDPEEAGAEESAAAEVPYRKLAGRWLRSDGQYVIDVQEVAADGRMKAAYFNPAPIRVSEAKASRKDNSLDVFVELRDVNYPGCTYRLAYNPLADQLEGVYFQAALGEEFAVVFVRLPE